MTKKERIPWNKKYPDKWTCETCKIKFPHKGHKRRFCSPKCWGKSKIGQSPWNKGLKGRQHWHNIEGLVPVKKGNTQGFQKGFIPKTAWKKGHKPWNYVDGRSKTLGSARYGPNWKKIRARILIRDDYKCQDCGVHKSQVKFIDIHHIQPFVESLNNSEENLITFCRKCHIKNEI